MSARISTWATALAALVVSAIAIGAATRPTGAAEPGGPPRGDAPRGRAPGTTAPSRVLNRGDLQILTYETEQDYDRLQESFRATETTQPQPGKMISFYLKSRTDGSVQPYAVYVPKGYTPDRKYPLVVQLHGLSFHEVLSGSRVRYQGMGGPQWVQPDLPIMYVNCFGRPSGFYRGIAEQDVLEVIDEVKRRFPVDSERVFLMGHSMGGCGSYEIGLHHPDLFGGIMPIDAAMGANAGVNKPGPDWMTPQIAIYSPQSLYPNARNVDVFLKNAGAGIQRKSTEYTDGIVEQGGFSTSESFPGMPHNFGDQYAYANFITELIQHPIRRHPAQVKYYTNTLRYDHAYWVTIDRLTRSGADTLVTATCDEKKGITVATKNIDALTLRLDDSPAPKEGSLVVDGANIAGAGLRGTLHLSKQAGSWKAGEWTAGPLVKKHGLQGPLEDAFNSHFLAVYGESLEGLTPPPDRELAIAELDAIRNPPSVLDIHGDFPMKPAHRVTREDIESSNLILFGTPETNAVLKRIAAKLPPEMMKSDDGSQTIFIYPNPENPARYVVVWPTKLLSVPNEMLDHAWIMPLCLLPDYVRVKDGKIVAGGHFDGDWKAGK